MKVPGCIWVSLCLAWPALAGNILEQGSFDGGSPGGPPPAPWAFTESKPGISMVVENPPGEKGHWIHLVDESAQDAIAVAQKFDEIKGGRFNFRLHVVKSNAAIWFLLGSKELNGRGDTVFSVKVTPRGSLLVSQAREKIVDTSGAKPTFPGGRTYDLYFDFKPEGEGLTIEIGDKNGAVFFRGRAASAAPIGALGIRTHGEEMGSDFYLADLSLESSPEP